MDKEDENENISDSEAAHLAWSIHLSINNSIIVDLFQVYISKKIYDCVANLKQVCYTK